MRTVLVTILAALAIALGGCRTTTPSQSSTAPPVLLISIDGLRAQDVTPQLTPNLLRLAHAGVRAEGMTPSYPSLTFPNHYTMVTGLVPDHHGIVHNSMRDAQLGEFRLSNRAAVGDGRWWGGEPIWVGAQKAGKRSATLYWPGSEAAIGGVRPTRWQPFDETVSAAARVDIVLGWLGEDAATRPHFATLYFDKVDHAGHDHGPGSVEAAAAIRDTDAAIGRLLDGLQARGQLDAVNIIVVSDHGMAEVAPTHTIAIEDMVPFSKQDATIVSIGQVIGITPVAEKRSAVEAALLGQHNGYDCWKKEALPTRWRYGSHPRVPAIVCQMNEGWDALPRDVISKRGNRLRGSHGYDPTLPSMRAVFLARGPAFRAGSSLPVFTNVDVYPLLARIIGIRAAPNDGNPRTFDSVLRGP